MCNIFPEVSKCCVCCTLRVGMVFIAVFSIMSGSALLSIVEGDRERIFDEPCDENHTNCNHTNANDTDSNVTTTTTTTPSTTTMTNHNHTKYMWEKGHSIWEYKDAMTFYDYMRDFVTMGLCIHAWLFIIAGLVLLLNIFSSEDGWAQIFTWVTFFNVIIGSITTILLAFDCTVKGPRCFMGMDWFESAFFTSVSFFFYAAWFYFIMVSSSFVQNGDTPVDRF